jgi:hypothetical protein
MKASMKKKQASWSSWWKILNQGRGSDARVPAPESAGKLGQIEKLKFLCQGSCSRKK